MPAVLSRELVNTDGGPGPWKTGEGAPVEKAGDIDMFVKDEKHHTQETIKEELERLYIAAGYINADDGNMEVAMHLIGAAIAALEGRDEPEAAAGIRIVYRQDDPAG